MNLEGYGCPGRSAVEYGLAALELEAGDSGIRTFVSVQGSLAMGSIHRWGSEEQKQEWLPRMARGEVIGSFGLTEPAAGSDPSSMKTFARRDGDDWVLTGSKRWIGLASIAQLAVVWAQTDDGVRGFIVPTDAPGFHIAVLEPKLSMRASVQTELQFDDVRLPASALLPGARGLRGPFSALNEARYGIVWGALGAGRDSYEAALRYALAREQFGRPIAGFQLTQQKLVDMVVELQKGALLALHLGPAEGCRNPAARADLARQAQQRARGDRDRPRGPHDPRRQRRAARALPDPPCGEPRVGAHLRGHRRGAHPHPGRAPDGHRRVPLTKGCRPRGFGVVHRIR